MPVRPPRHTLRAPPAVITGRFAYSVDVWSAATGALVSHVADVPLQEAVPTHTDGVPTGPRAWRWQPASGGGPAALLYVTAADGGDPLREVAAPAGQQGEGVRDVLCRLPGPPFQLGDHGGGGAEVLLEMCLRYRGLVHAGAEAAEVEGAEGSAGPLLLVSESWWAERRRRQWLVRLRPPSPGAPAAAAAAAAQVRGSISSTCPGQSVRC